jgi:arylformamidase
MPLYDISLTISNDFPTWPGDPPIELKQISKISQGDHANVSHISTPVHIATHVDAPDHFLGNGITVDEIALELLIGPALVVEVPNTPLIVADDLANLQIPGGTKRILFKTANSEFWKESKHSFQEGFIALGSDAAKILVEMGVQVIGVDYLSVAAFNDPVPTHKILLEAGILIIEGLDLSKISPGTYKLYCLPLKIKDCDGAPARVLLED